MDTGGLPHPPLSLIQEIKSICPNLFIVPSRWRINPRTQKPYLNENGEPIEHIRYNLFIANDDGSVEFLWAHETPEGEFLPADRRIVERIGNDLARIESNPLKLEKMLRDAEAEEIERAKQKRQERIDAFVEANASKIRREVMSPESLANPNAPTMSSPILYSYTGQVLRSSADREATDEEIKQTWEIPN